VLLRAHSPQPTRRTPLPHPLLPHPNPHAQQGDLTIPAYTPVEEEWFCDGYAAMLG